MVNRKRITMLNDIDQKSGAVVYWISRDQRAGDNWALLFAQELALELKAPLAVVFCLVPEFLGATIRQYGFMVKGLRGVEEKLAEANIPFFLLTGTPGEEVPRFVESCKGGALVTDFNPLRIKRVWNRRVTKALAVPFYEVDAHNIVPCRIASSKQEYGAYTFRPKIRRALQDFLTDFPPLVRHPFPWVGKKEMTEWDRVMDERRVDCSVPEVDWLEPGESAGREALRDFLENRLNLYHSSRNDPSCRGQSGLSPYLHFGHISPQRAALETERCDEHVKSQEAFMEELVVRRELSDNFCFYNDEYDSFQGFPEWARKSLNMHRDDPREYVYSAEKFEKGETHDLLWNAAQRELVLSGKMHGYMRMYWAKKILEWTESPEKAIEIAIRLNDRYGLDGRDPNGYAGIAWSIGGVHDRAWKERPVFGKIRYMSLDGCRRKFDVRAYIKKWG
jgi:deoxyribodipyrimidine photo-lyase